MHGGQLQLHLNRGPFKASSSNVELAPGSVTGYRDVSTDNEQNLMSTVALQQVSFTIEAYQSSFKSYRSGVFRCIDRCMRQEMFKKAAFNSNGGG